MNKLKISAKYGVAPHSILYSQELSLKAKGLYTYMQSKPDGWKFSATRIATECREERGSIEAGLKELEDFGVLLRERCQNENGTWGWNHTLLDKPMLENPAMDEPMLGNPMLENPMLENPALENPAIYKEVVSKKDITRKKEQSGDAKRVAEVIKLFETVDPKNKLYYGNKTQREAVGFLLDEYGFEEVQRRILVLPRVAGLPYFPTITTPVQLRDKWVALDTQIQKHLAETEHKKDLVAF